MQDNNAVPGLGTLKIPNNKINNVDNFLNSASSDWRQKAILSKFNQQEFISAEDWSSSQLKKYGFILIPD